MDDSFAYARKLAQTKSHQTHPRRQATLETLKVSLEICESIVVLTPIFGEQLKGLLGIAKKIVGVTEVRTIFIHSFSLFMLIFATINSATSS